LKYATGRVLLEVRTSGSTQQLYCPKAVEGGFCRLQGNKHWITKSFIYKSALSRLSEVMITASIYNACWTGFGGKTLIL
jgi:hypothetical protein